MKKIKGFSLMELVVTITVIMILSLIAGPIYNTYATKAKMAEGYALLGTIRSAQETYFRTYDTFIDYFNNQPYTCNHEILGIDARPNKYYTWFCVNYGYDKTKGYWAQVRANGYPGIVMVYNLTTGVTFQ